MKMLIVTQYFWPEYWLINRLSQKLVEAGHDITVATGKPNYPEGVLYSGYKIRGVTQEDYGGVNVVRVPMLPRRKGLFNLALNYLSFILSGMWYFPALFKNKKFDIIFVFAPSPITQTIPAIWLNRHVKAHLSVWVQDLWPESMRATGHIKNKLILKTITFMVRWIYSAVDSILIQSHAFREPVSALADVKKIEYYPNSIEDAELQNEEVVLPKLVCDAFSDGFNVVFSGNIGSAQSIPAILHAAQILKKHNCTIIFVGGGSLLQWAREEVNRMDLCNVKFTGRLDNKYMRAIYREADALLVSLTDNEIFSYTVPGKVQAYMAAGKPIIASLNGEAGRIIREANAGLVSCSEDAEGLAENIVKLSTMSKKSLKEMGACSRKYFKENFDLDVLSERLVSIFNRRREA